MGGPSTFGQGNYNIIPKGAAHPKQAFEFIAWLAGYKNEAFNSPDGPQGRLDAGLALGGLAARLQGVAQGQPVA